MVVMTFISSVLFLSGELEVELVADLEEDLVARVRLPTINVDDVDLLVLLFEFAQDCFDCGGLADPRAPMDEGVPAVALLEEWVDACGDFALLPLPERKILGGTRTRARPRS